MVRAEELCPGAPMLRLLSAVPAALMEGKSSLRDIAYWARDCSTLRAAILRSRLFVKAVPTSFLRRGSTKNFCQAMSAVTSPPVFPGNREATGAEMGSSAGVSEQLAVSMPSAAIEMDELRMVNFSFLRLGASEAGDDFTHHHEEYGDEENSENGAGDHPSRHAGADRILAGRSCTGADDKW